jgi:hypothetical protein
VAKFKDPFCFTIAFIKRDSKGLGYSSGVDHLLRMLEGLIPGNNDVCVCVCVCVCVRERERERERE